MQKRDAVEPTPKKERKEDSPPDIDECSLEVQNWVITCDVECPLHPSAAKLTRFSLDLHQVAIRLRHLGMQYNPERFHAIIRRFRNPSAAVLVFEGGAVVCTGAKTQERAELLVSSTIRDIASLREYSTLRMRQGSWNVRNVVGSATMPFEIDLQLLYDANAQYSAYEPDVFPGATFRLSNPWARAILLFESGNLVITGAQSDKGLAQALELCMPFIWSARKGISKEQYLKEQPKKTAEQLVREQLCRDASVTDSCFSFPLFPQIPLSPSPFPPNPFPFSPNSPNSPNSQIPKPLNSTQTEEDYMRYGRFMSDILELPN